MLCIKLRERKVEHHASKYSVITHTLDPWVGWDQKVRFFLTSESGHVAYQIKGNEV